MQGAKQCLQTFLRTILPNITNNDIKQRRIRCFGHIINLSARAFLFGKNPDAFEVEDAMNISLERHLEKSEAWRKQGPVGKLHNIATWIKRSPQRIARFKKVSQGLEAEFQPASHEDGTTRVLGIIVGNATRWNSTLYMIRRGLKVRDALRMFISKLDRNGDVSKRVPHEDRLSNDDWLILAEIADVLTPFEELTIWLQSQAKNATHGSVWETLPAIEQDEYETYISSRPVACDHPLEWWRANQSIYPKLAQMAFDLLSIPAMSAECERVFSQAKLALGQQQNRMTEDTLEAIQCLKNWNGGAG